MNRWVGKVAIVTGASSGIGAAITEALVKEGLSVVGLSRRSEMMEKLSKGLNGAKGQFNARQCDVTKDDELLNAFEWVEAEFGGADVLVNNAGVGKSQRIIDGDIQTYRSIMDVNFLATAFCVQKAVASMQSRKVAGHIINVNSIFGHPDANTPLPGSIYPPSKFAVTSLTRIVRKELATANSKIKITNLSPGTVATEIFEKAGIPNSNEMLKRTPSLEAKDVADAVVYILGTPEHVQISEFIIQPIGEKM